MAKSGVNPTIIGIKFILIYKVDPIRDLNYLNLARYKL